MRINLQPYKHQATRLWFWLLSKDILIFLLFVGLVSAFWWGRSMTSSRDGNIRVELHYSGVDDRVVFATPLPSQLTIHVRDNGKQLRHLSKQTLTLNLNLSSLLVDREGKLELTADMLRPRLQDILPGSTIILQITPEQIQTPYHIQSAKVVPIALQAQVSYAPQHQALITPQLSIDSVCIYGAERALNTIDCIYTDSVIINDLRDSITQSVALQVPSHVRCNTSQIQVTFMAEPFTDKSFTLPIRTENVPAGEHMRLFPQQTTVMVRVGISHYAHVTMDDLTAICYYPSKHSDALPIEIHTQNPYISNIRCYPSAVEYIIER
jgi:YbbR domain-containing protein